MLLRRHPACKDVVCIMNSIKGGVTRWLIWVCMMMSSRGLTVTLSKEGIPRGKILSSRGFILELRRGVNPQSSSLALGSSQ